jgi:hypothetical protein
MDYTKGKIYKITDNAYTKMYIGSTIQPLCKRFAHHKAKYLKWKNGSNHKLTVFEIFDEFSIENCKIELIENYSCNSKEQLEQKEGDHIRINDCVNKRIEGRTKKQYTKDTTEIRKEYKKKYYQENKGKLIEKSTNYYNINDLQIKENHRKIVDCECGNQYTLGNKSRHLKSKKHIEKINI